MKRKSCCDNLCIRISFQNITFYQIFKQPSTNSKHFPNTKFLLQGPGKFIILSLMIPFPSLNPKTEKWSSAAKIYLLNTYYFSSMIICMRNLTFVAHLLQEVLVMNSIIHMTIVKCISKNMGYHNHGAYICSKFQLCCTLI